MTADEDRHGRQKQPDLFKTTQPLFVFDVGAARARAAESGDSSPALATPLAQLSSCSADEAVTDEWPIGRAPARGLEQLVMGGLGKSQSLETHDVLLSTIARVGVDRSLGTAEAQFARIGYRPKHFFAGAASPLGEPPMAMAEPATSARDHAARARAGRVGDEATHAGVTPSELLRTTQAIASETAQAVASKLMLAALASLEQVIARRSEHEKVRSEPAESAHAAEADSVTVRGTGPLTGAADDVTALEDTDADVTLDAPSDDGATEQEPAPSYDPALRAPASEESDSTSAASPSSQPPPLQTAAARAAGVTQRLVPEQPRPTSALPFRASPRLSARSPLFRAEAIAAYARGERAASVLRITTVSRWSLLLGLGAALLVALGVISFAHVEERSAARGVLRMPFGISPALSLISGRVREVLVAPGASVAEGQLLARLDTTPIEAERVEAAQRLSALRAQWQLQSRSLHAQFERSETLGKARIALLTARQAGQRRRIARNSEQVRRVHAPELETVIEHTVRDQTEDTLDGARDELLRMSDELSALRLQRSSSRSEYEQQLAAGEERIREAEAKLEATGILLQQAELRAPSAGKVESLRVHPGQTVQAGEWIARIVRDGTPDTIVAFVPEREAAFLRVGAPARVEIDKLPPGEFGLAKARVQRVGGELAEASELVTSLGEGALTGPHVRVELALEAAPETQRLRQFMRAGTLVTARIALRDRRLLAIVFEPVRKWLE